MNVHENRIDNMFRLMQQIEEFKTERGTVWIYFDQMDCDHFRADSMDEVVASLPAVRHCMDELIREVEGYVCELRLATEDEARSYYPSQRDLAMEAYENGHPHVIYA